MNNEKNSPELNRLFQTMTRGEIPNIFEILSALSEISEHNQEASGYCVQNLPPDQCLECG